MKEKKIFYSEAAYIVGLVLLALGASFMGKADFGFSMIVAPAYVIHAKVSEFLPFYSFGMSEYVLQALLLAVLSIVVKKVKISYFLSVVTAVIYGVILDLFISLVSFVALEGLFFQIVFYVLGVMCCTSGVAFLFNTYLPIEAYEMFVKEISRSFGIPLGKVKTIYDCLSCLFAIVLSLVLFGTLVGIGFGTVLCAIINGPIISLISKHLNKKFVFKDALPLRRSLE